MNSLLKMTSILLLSSGAITVHAASQSVTINYSLTIPTACSLSNNGTSFNKTLPHDGTAVDQSINVKCNVPYTIKASSVNKAGDNKSNVVNSSDTTLKIPYEITLTGGPIAVNVNGGASTSITPSSSTKTDTYNLSAKTASPITIEDYIAGTYTDAVTVEISY